jgi:hypothetical protein
LVRALLETFAVFDEFVRELLSCLAREDLGAMDDLVMNRTFATKDNDLLHDHPNLVATNALTFINKMGKHYGLPIRANYDSLSERCHPNSAGHHQMYSTTEKPSAALKRKISRWRLPTFALRSAWCSCLRGQWSA